MFEIEQVTLPELTGDTERNVYIYVPDSFEHNQDLRYPVLYMFDGQNVFIDEDASYGKSWGMKDFMDYTDMPIMVVGIASNQSPDNSRLEEYSPYSFDDHIFGYVEGKGYKTMDWIVNELKPYIDENYPTLPDRAHTLIAGSSMGGLMSYFALVKYNHIFSKAAALSPSLWARFPQLVKDLKEADLDPDTVIYMDYGSEEDHGRFGKRAVKCFWEMTRYLQRKKVFVTSRIIPYGNHSEASWEKQVPIFLTILLDTILEDLHQDVFMEEENFENEDENFEYEENFEEYENQEYNEEYEENQ